MNQDRTLLGSATTQTSTFSLRCPRPSGLTDGPAPGVPIAFDERSRFLFETGLGGAGSNVIVGVGADFSGTNCNSTPPLAFYGTSVLLSADDRRNKRVYVLSSAGPGTPDVLTSISTNGAGDYYAPTALSKLGQTSLDNSGTYSAMVTDTDGTVGYAAMTQVRTSTSPGGLWIYNPSLNRAVKVLGPGGVALPAVNAFILHNPKSVGGGLLVLTNQDLLTANNLSAPPTVTSPFTIIDMGQLGALVQAHPTDASVTLPFMTTVTANLSYYAIFGSAYNSVDNKIYLLTGTGDAANNPLRQVIRYDPFQPAAPADTVVADLTAASLFPGDRPQITLNAAAGSLQVLTANPSTVYSVDITGTGDTAKALTGSTFGDTGFQPVAIASNPLLGETYIASASGKIDILTLASTRKPRGAINLNGPLSAATPGVSTSLQIESTFPLYESSLTTTPITITATAASTGKSFVFAAPNAVDTLLPTRYIAGTFPSADTYTLVASFPGDSTYSQVNSLPVTVAVGTSLYPTTIAVAATASTATAGTATVTLSGSTYTPTGTIVIQDAASASTLATATLAPGSFANPVSIAFTVPAGTTSVTATYSGDSINGGSHSSAATIVSTAPKSNTHLTLNAPATAAPNVSFNTTVFMNSDNGNVPSGSIILNATPAGSTASQVGSTTTAGAFSGGATIALSLPAGTYTLQAVYAGDAKFNSSGSNYSTITIATVTPAVASLSATSLTFTSTVGSTSAYQNVTLTNTGGSALNISSINVTGTGFAQVNGCPVSLAAGANCVIRVNFTPSTTGTVTGAVSIADNATGSPQMIQLSGAASLPVSFVGTPSTTFATDQVVGTSSIARPVVTVTNNTTSSFLVNITLDNKTDFEQGPGCSGGMLAPGSSCSLLVTFHPGSPGAKTGTFTLNGAPAATAPVIFKGNGLAANTCADADLDKLCDDWETNGVWVRVAGAADQFIDLPAMGASPMHKDIFLHIDSMVTDPKAPGAHDHTPKSAAMQAIVTAFNNAPLMNPDLTTGIHLHVDCGPTCYSGTGGIAGTLSKAVKIAEITDLDPTPFDKNTGAFSWTQFDLNSKVFAASGRALVFHHVLFSHNQHPGYGSSGISRNPDDPNFFDGASDLVISFGLFPSVVGSVTEQANTLMHELGHNLGLAHGGQDQYNRKPNYLSVMNYLFQLSGLTVNGKDHFLDYSENALPSLNEQKLNELQGLSVDFNSYPAVGPLPSLDKVGTLFFCFGDDPLKVAPQRVANLDDMVNWDCIKTPSVTYLPSVRTSINADSLASNLQSYKDWPNLKFSGGAVGGNGLGTSQPAVTSGQFEATQELARLADLINGVTVTGPNMLSTAPGSTMTLHYTVRNIGSVDDQFNLSLVSEQGWSKTVFTPATLALTAGASAEVTVVYTVPAKAAQGDMDHLSFQAKSVANPLALDTAELYAYAETNPVPLSISAASVVFGVQAPGGSSAADVLQVVNTGTSAVTFTGIMASADFQATNNCGTTLAPGASCTVNVAFSPASAGAKTGTLTVTSSASGTPLTASLMGTSAAILPHPAITLTATPAATATGQTVTLKAAIPAIAPAGVPTGTVTFSNDATLLGSATLDASGNAVFTSSSLGAGSYTVFAQYSGDAAYAPGITNSIALVIAVATPSNVTLSTSGAMVQTGMPVTLTARLGGGTAGTQPTGNVTFLDGATVLGTATLNASGVATYTTSTLGLGAHSITATYGGDNVFAASTSAVLAQTIVAAGPAATTSTLTSSVAMAPVGTSIVFTATVAAAAGTPGGSVTFTEAGATLGSGTLNASGVATFTTSSLAAGTHQIVAAYAGTAAFAASTSSARQVLITAAADYSVAVTPASLSIQAGSAATASFVVTPLNGYAGMITFGCSGLPANATCTFAPAQLTFTAGAQATQTTTLTFDTRLHASLSRPQLFPRSTGGALTALAFVLWMPISLLGFTSKGRRSGKQRRRLLTLLGWLAVLIPLASTGGCGSSSPVRATTPGTYNVNVSITDGTASHSIVYPVTVTQ